MPADDKKISLGNPDKSFSSIYANCFMLRKPADGGINLSMCNLEGAVFIGGNYLAAYKIIGGAGYTYVEASSFNVKSSRKVKENIIPMTDDEAKKIMDVQIVEFDYKDCVGGQKNQRGVIAEDVINVIPSVVNVPSDYNEDTDNFVNTPSVDYSKFVPYLIKMVQIQQKQIDELLSNQ